MNPPHILWVHHGHIMAIKCGTVARKAHRVVKQMLRIKSLGAPLVHVAIFIYVCVGVKGDQ